MLHRSGFTIMALLHVSWEHLRLTYPFPWRAFIGVNVFKKDRACSPSSSSAILLTDTCKDLWKMHFNFIDHDKRRRWRCVGS